MKKYKIAAILMIIHGGFMELGGIFAMIPALLIGTDNPKGKLGRVTTTQKNSDGNIDDR